MFEVKLGALCFGLVAGWLTYRTLRRKEGNAAISDIAAVLAAVGGGAVTALFQRPFLFAWYSIGLAAGFFLYFILGLILEGKTGTRRWMGE
jgi:hypothetical protein